MHHFVQHTVAQNDALQQYFKVDLCFKLLFFMEKIELAQELQKQQTSLLKK